MIAPHKYVIVKVHHTGKIGNSSLVIPDSCGIRENHEDYYGEVIAVGPECPYRDEIKIGDKILYFRNEGIKIQVNFDTDYFALKPRALLGIYQDV